jgi:uncharacterized OsmC-like protein
MSETIFVHQSRLLETTIQASFSEKETSMRTVEMLHELTPYGMMLVSLGICTAMVVNTFAQNNNYPLDEVRIKLQYERKFKEDCENCTGIDRDEEAVFEEIEFHGTLSEQQHSRLSQVAHLCPIYKMYKGGIEIHTEIT